MKFALAVCGLTLATASAASASGNIFCRNADESVSLNMMISRSDTLTVVRTVLIMGDETWSDDPVVQPVLPIRAGQAYENDGALLVDFVAEAEGAVIARLKAFSTMGEDDYVSGGIFTVKGKGSWVVDCSDRG